VEYFYLLSALVIEKVKESYAHKEAGDAIHGETELLNKFQNREGLVEFDQD
jgi:hypothetical protein